MELRKDFPKRFAKLIFGLFLFAIAASLTIQAKVGFAPWDVFHVGLAGKLGFRIGFTNIIVGLIVLIITALLKEKIGLGSITNMFLVGVLMDLLLYNGVIPPSQSHLTGYIMLISGIIVMGFASYFYISAGFGSGPRDSLMVAIARNTKLSIGASRFILEASVTAIGYFLGGMVGLGTLIFVILIGPSVHYVFMLFHYAPHRVKHEGLGETLSYLIKKDK